MYLQTPMDRYKYMQIRADLIPEACKEAYDLWDKVYNGHIYMDIRRKQHLDHLITSIKHNYDVTVDYTGSLFCGIMLNWHLAAMVPTRYSSSNMTKIKQILRNITVTYVHELSLTTIPKRMTLIKFASPLVATSSIIQGNSQHKQQTLPQQKFSGT
eukprot:CCRYP_021179-RA/>CCRYP_021179-RA protein AED:0.47 eAED:0.47 QI:0/0/0/1/0/0/2/0/155